MSRPIAYNASGPLSGSIRGGNVNYTVDSGNRDYTTFASKKWVPSADGAAPIVFVTDTYTQGFELNPSLAVPLFYSCNGTGSAAIIYTANRIPGSPGNYSDANVALNDLISARGYFILESNDPFEGVDADGLALDLDAAKMSSYPQVGTNWRDLSGNGITNALVNGPTWNSNGWFTFDGTDDYGVNTDSLLNITSNVTMNAWIRHSGTGDPYGNYASKDANLGYRMRRDGTSGSPLWLYASGNNTVGGAIYDNLWYMVTGVFSSTGLRGYINGNLVASNSNPYASTPSGPFYIGAFVVGSELFGGNMMGLQVYASALTTTEIKQNYFGAPIVTDGLVFAVDANNIVSYPKSGTSAYNLTGSNTLTLQNGLQYKLGNGGYFLSDGTDDALDTPDASNLDIAGNFTVEGWVWWNRHKDYASLLVKGPGGSGNIFNYCFFFYASNIVCGFGDGSAFYNVSISTPTTNTWHHIVGTYDGSNLRFYLDGILANTSAITATPYQNTSYLNVIQGDYPIDGRVANARVYNRALTAAEVQQNYQAEQYRFETPAGPVTNGLLLYWDAGNLDSYPGTGTTIYDLSGNGNNGTLYNGVGYNQTNGGVLTFDGVDDYGISYNPNLQTTTSTVMGAARYSGATRGRIINSTDVNWLMGHWNNSTENYYAEGTIALNNGPSDTNWRIYSALGNQPADTWSLYVNNSLAVSNNGGVSGPDGISIGAQTYGGVSEYSTGQFSFVLVYNRVLTTAEMTQNYNYFKGRFGL
jgi:hypothetical protein